MIGADGRDRGGSADAGAAYVFEQDGKDFRLAATLSIEQSQPLAAFGYCVAMDGDTLAVGAPGLESGAVYVFERKDGAWPLVTTLRVDALGPRSGLGHSVAVDGSRVLAGAPMSNRPSVLSGAAFVFERTDQWRLAGELEPAARTSGERFGRSVALYGGLALVGAPRARVGDRTRAGRVWAFRQSQSGSEWLSFSQIEGLPPRSDGELGRTVALGDGWAVVVSQFLDAVGQATGGAELFQVTGDLSLKRAGTLLAADPRPMNEFASAAAVGSTEILIGAPRRGPNDDATGFVYTYSIPGESE